MKKLTAAMLCLSLSLCGCNSKPITEIHIAQTVTGENVIIDTPDTMYLGDAVHAVATIPVTSSAVDDKNNVIFTQSYQKFRFYLDNNQVQKTIEDHLQQKMDQFFADAATIQAQAREDCFDTEDWVPYYAKIHHTATRVDGAVISLYTLHESYNGTAPVCSVSAVSFDAVTGDVLYLGDILDCTGSMITPILLQQLTGVEGLYEGYEDTLRELFSGSIQGFSGWYLNPEGLCILFSPYELSPVGVEVTIPYSMLEGLLKEDFLPAPSTAGGTIGADILGEDDAERFSFMAELELSQNGSEVVIYPNETVNNLRIEIGDLTDNAAVYTPTHTIFATDAFYLGNAVVIRTPMGEDAPTLRVSFFSGGQEMSAYVLYNSEDDSILLAYG